MWFNVACTFQTQVHNLCLKQVNQTCLVLVMSQKLNSNEFTHSMKTKTTIQRQPNDKPWVLIMSTEETHEELCGDQANHKEA